MNELLLQLGVGGIFAIMVIREVFTWLGKRPEKTGMDESAFPSWLRIQLQQAVTQLSKDMQSQTDMMRDIRDELSNINKTLFGVSGEYEKIKENIDRLNDHLENFSERRSKNRGNGN